MASAFSTVVAYIATDFIQKFPAEHNFGEMLKGVCCDAGVEMSELGDEFQEDDSKYNIRLKGQWSLLENVHQLLITSLTRCLSSIENKQENENESTLVLTNSLSRKHSPNVANTVDLQEHSNKTKRSKRKCDFSKKINRFEKVDTVVIDGVNVRGKKKHIKSTDKQTAQCQVRGLLDNSDKKQNLDNVADGEIENESKEKLYTDDIKKDSAKSETRIIDDQTVKTTSKCKSLAISCVNNETETCSKHLNKNKTPVKSKKAMINSSTNDKITTEPMNDVAEMRTDTVYSDSRTCDNDDDHDNDSVDIVSKSSLEVVETSNSAVINPEILNEKKETKEYSVEEVIERQEHILSKIPVADNETLHRKRGRPHKCVTDGKQEFTCVDCPFRGKTKSALSDHRHRMHLAKAVKCDVCDKVFPNTRYMKRHLYSHGNPKHVCNICGKLYKAMKALREHMKTHADNYSKPQFECTQCSKSFCTQYVLECHIKSEHFGQKKSFLCSTCGKSFTTKHTLIQHQNVHTGLRPYKCQICGKTFAYESALRDHKYIHSGTKKFICLVCSKGFSQRSALKMHEKIHKEKRDFECTECGRGFTQKQALQRHERSHKGDRPFRCKICHKTFGDSSTIRRHVILVHKIHKDPAVWREDITKCAKGDNSDEIDTESQLKDIDESSINSSYDSCRDIISVDLNSPKSVPESYMNPSSQSPSSHQDSMLMAEQHVDNTTSQYQTDHNSYFGVVPVAPQSSPVDYHIPTQSHNSYQYIYISPSAGTTSESTDVSSASSDGSTLQPSCDADDQYHYNAQMTGTTLPRVENIIEKRELESQGNLIPENISVSSLYAYYTNVASQYLNVSAYPGYVNPHDETN